MKHPLTRFFLKFFSVTLFLVVTLFTIFFAYGYRFDTDKGEVQKTSIIDIASPKTVASVYLDGIEQSKSLPVQLKNVLPGSHDLIVQKDGFISWSRGVDVTEDIVSIVNDVLLIPRDRGKYTSVISDVENNLFVGDGYVFSYSIDSNFIKSFVFRDFGIVSNKEISLYRDDFEIVDVYSEDDVLLKFQDDVYAYLSFESGSYYLFTLPQDQTDLFVDIASKSVFYIVGTDLYVASFDSPVIKIADHDFFVFNGDNSDLIFSDVSGFSVGLGTSKLFFYKTDGSVYVSNIVDLQTSSLLKVVSCDDLVDDLSVFDADNYEMLTVACGEQKSFYLVDSLAVTFIFKGLEGRPFFDGDKRILYLDPLGKLFYFDFKLDDFVFIFLFEEEVDLLGWFDSAGHYLYKQDNIVYVSDIFGGLKLPLLECSDLVSFVYAKNGALFWFDDKTLKRLYWNDSF